ncbi:hypothetical protein Lal_00048865 [Lupinus albus]|nr:hypothetical protein Lal_00048865 [Lupinus albus]
MDIMIWVLVILSTVIKLGDKIQAVVKNYHISQWKSELREGCTYIGQNFDVVLNEGQYRDCNHVYKLIYQKVTIMKAKELKEISPYIYILNVIGEIFDIEMIQSGSNPSKVVFSMRDQSSNSVSCTLSDQFASQLITYEANYKDDWFSNDQYY